MNFNYKRDINHSAKIRNGHGLGNDHNTDYVINEDDFMVNADYISVMVNPKSFMIRSQYRDAALFLDYDTNITVLGIRV